MVTYGTFKKWLHTANGDDVESRNWANGQLLKLRGSNPGQYQEYVDRVRQEAKGQIIVRY